MKLIIDIPEETYEQVKMCINGINNIVEIRSAIRQSTPLPDNTTNGDMIKALFPDSELHKESDYISLTFKKGVEIVAYIEDRGASWWNAPYKVGTTATPIPETPIADWVESMIGLHVTTYKCSKCGRVVMDDTGYDVVKDYPYCNCGAKIKGVIKKCEN